MRANIGCPSFRAAARGAMACAVALAAAARAQNGSVPADLPAVRWHLTARPWTPLDTPATNALDLVEDIVNALRPLQETNPAAAQYGAIIDPYLSPPDEHQYATPYFAFAVATVCAHSNRGSQALFQAGARALDHATLDITGADGDVKANDNHGEFFTAPMTKALALFEQMSAAPGHPYVVPAATLAVWRARMGTSRAFLNSTNAASSQNNWRTYAMKGEWQRVRQGLITRSDGVGWIETSWTTGGQRGRFLNDPYFKIYHDFSGDPQTFAYNGGAAGNLLDMIFFDYDGPSAADMKGLLFENATLDLALMGASGEAPACGRSGNHVWNDMVYANTFEQMAELKGREGDALAAGRFRRAASLALRSVRRFQQEIGWLSVTKNLFHPSRKVRYASYSALSNYNGYNEIHGSELYWTRTTAIPEQPAPAEIGGYALMLDGYFSNVFLNAGGLQMQVALAGTTNAQFNQNWHTLGGVRFSRAGWDSRLGPGDGIREASSGRGASFCPVFLEGSNWVMLAEQPARYRGTFAPQFVHPLLVRGALTFSPHPGQTGPVFTLDLTLTPDLVRAVTRSSGAQPFGVIWPLLGYDGKRMLRTSVSNGVASTGFSPENGTRIVLQAEDASASGGVATASLETGYTGSGYAVFPSNGGSLAWSGVDGGAGGEATIGFRYALGTAAARTGRVVVNGTTSSVPFESTGFSNDWHQIHLPAVLVASTANAIRLESTGQGLGFIDELRVFPAVAGAPAPDRQHFIALGASNALDTGAEPRRSGYGDLRPIRQTAPGATSVVTLVYPAGAGDPAGEAVRAGYTALTNGFVTPLARVEGDLYVGRWAAGGEGTGLDLGADGTNDVSFDRVCGFFLRHTNGAVDQLEADRPAVATIGGRTFGLAAFTPVVFSTNGPMWDNRALSDPGASFEATCTVTPGAAALDVYAGLAPSGVNETGGMAAAVWFAPDGIIRALDGGGFAALTALAYESGRVYTVRFVVEQDLGVYTVFVKPAGGPERRLAVNAHLGAGAAGGAALIDWFTRAAPGEAAFTGPAIASASPFAVSVNFQPAGSPVPAGYLPDVGETFGPRTNGFSYGWIGDTNAYARDRNSVLSPDQRYDTLNHMQHSAVGSNRIWEIALSNRTYQVTVVCGDPSYTDSLHHVLVEDATGAFGAMSATQHWVTGTATVALADGRLTLTPGPAGTNTKVCFVDVVEVLPPATNRVHYDRWAASNFPGGVGDPDAASMLDPDGDGRPNALEYACGTNPRAPDYGPVVSINSVPDAAGRAVLRFGRAAAAVDVSYRMLHTTDAAAWTLLWDGNADADFTGPFSQVADPNADGPVTIFAPALPGNGIRYFRLEVDLRVP